jgi:opacity protein-like surface antigen
MNKTALIGISLLLVAGSSLAAGFRVELKGSFFSSENAIFRDVYGNTAKFGLEGGLDIVKNVSVFAGLDHVRKSGGLTVSEEETRVWLTPLTLGVRYEIPAGEKVRFHVGAGGQEIFFKEEASLGTVKENALGFLVTGGAMYSLSKSVSIGLCLEWSTCKMKHEDVEFKAGGLDLGVGVEFRF